jgi:hypothetical protein
MALNITRIFVNEGLTPRSFGTGSLPVGRVRIGNFYDAKLLYNGESKGAMRVYLEVRRHVKNDLAVRTVPLPCIGCSNAYEVTFG